MKLHVLKVGDTVRPINSNETYSRGWQQSEDTFMVIDSIFELKKPLAEVTVFAGDRTVMKTSFFCSDLKRITLTQEQKIILARHKL